MAFGHKNRLAWEINGAYGSVRWNLEQPNCLGLSLRDEGPVGFKEVSVTDRDHPHASDWWPPGHHLGWEHGHVIGIAQFLRCVVDNQPLPEEVPTFTDGCRVAEVIDCAARVQPRWAASGIAFEPLWHGWCIGFLRVVR